MPASSANVTGEDTSSWNRKSLSVTYRLLSELRPDPKNPRAHSRKQIRQIAESIRQFGFTAPVLLDGDDNVVAGHGRILACQELGWADVPTISLTHLTPAQAKAYMIADNRLTENSEWNERLLAEQFKELSLLDLDFELDVTGFELADIDLRIESLGEAGVEEPDPADHIEPNSGPPVTTPGDIWTLGSHRLTCGSALEPASYGGLLSGETADLVFSDPPYNVSIQGHVSGNGAVRHREFAMASGEMNRAEFTSFLQQTCTQLAANTKPGSVHFLCMDWRHLTELLTAGQSIYSQLLNVCVWVKHNGGMGSLYRSQHELVLVFKNGDARHCNNVQLGKFGRNRTNVWNYPAINNFGRGTDEGSLLAMHPTVKPVALVADAILDCSQRGDIVLDAFLGSGSTLIACERTGRACRGIELDPLYVDTAILRWQKYTGGTAIRASDGRGFNDCSSESAHVE